LAVYLVSIHNQRPEKRSLVLHLDLPTAGPLLLADKGQLVKKFSTSDDLYSLRDFPTQVPTFLTQLDPNGSSEFLLIESGLPQSFKLTIADGESVGRYEGVISKLQANLMLLSVAALLVAVYAAYQFRKKFFFFVALSIVLQVFLDFTISGTLNDLLPGSFKVLLLANVNSIVTMTGLMIIFAAASLRDLGKGIRFVMGAIVAVGLGVVALDILSHRNLSARPTAVLFPVILFFPLVLLLSSEKFLRGRRDERTKGAAESDDFAENFRRIFSLGLVIQSAFDVVGSLLYVSPSSEGSALPRLVVTINLAICAITVFTLVFITVREQRSQNAKLEADLSAAKAVQEALLPEFNQIPGMRISTYYRAAEQIGGDWIAHFYNPTTNHAYFCVGDVTGHGIPSALLTGVVCGSIFSSDALASSLFEGKSYDAEVHLNLIAATANEAVFRTGRRSGRVMTMLFAALDLATGDLTFVNAGHNSPYHLRYSAQGPEKVVSSGFRLGSDRVGKFGVKKIKIDRSEGFFAYTDGLIENQGEDKRRLTERALKKLLTQPGDPELVMGTILSGAQGIWKDFPVADDVSIILAVWDGPIAQPEAEKIWSELHGKVARDSQFSS
jgi:serine phosphatase RsbU (regulator of sigma subunit)